MVALLNDLLGIQARGGCSCAGPYGHRLLGIDLPRSHEFEREILKGCEGIKPGWVRVNFNYFISEAVFQFILDGVHLIANEGWKLEPHYAFDPVTGEWRHRAPRPDPAMRLTDLSYRSGKLAVRSRHATEPEWILESHLEEARRIIDDATRNLASATADEPKLDADFEHLRWFPLSSEILRELRDGSERFAASRPRRRDDGTK